MRELRNVVERAAFLVRGGLIAPDEIDLPGTGEVGTDPDEPELDLPGAVARLERRMIERALSEEAGNRTRAARRLGIQRQLLYAKMEKYGLAGDETAPSEITTVDVGKPDTDPDPCSAE